MVRILGKNYFEHRLAWLYCNAVWPSEQIDHINGLRDDNRICNLRPCTNGENHQNVGTSRVNKTGFVGVHFNPDSGVYVASIKHQGKKYHLGNYPAAEAAGAAYAREKRRLHSFQPTIRSTTESRSLTQ